MEIPSQLLLKWSICSTTVETLLDSSQWKYLLSSLVEFKFNRLCNVRKLVDLKVILDHDKLHIVGHVITYSDCIGDVKWV